jgi:hypothetical protein
MFLIRRGEFAVKERADSLFYKKMPIMMMMRRRRNENDPLTAPKTRVFKPQITNGPCKQSWKPNTQCFIYINNVHKFRFQMSLFLLSPTFFGLIDHFRQPVLTMLEGTQVFVLF